MAKRNQNNRSSLGHIPILSVKQLDVTGSVFIEGSSPELRLRMSNPGARTRMQITEQTFDLSDGAQYYDTTTLASAYKFSSSAMPQHSRLDAVGVYISSSFSGSGNNIGANEQTYIKRIGLTSSMNGPTEIPEISQPDYFFSNQHTPEHAGVYDSKVLHTAGSSSMFFPMRGRASGSAMDPDKLEDSVYYTGFTGSNTCVSFELSNTGSLTGSFVVSFHFVRYGPPTG